MNEENITSSGKSILIGPLFGHLDQTIQKDVLAESTKNVAVIAVDGGYHFCSKLGIKPALFIGDFDSLENKIASDSTARVIQLDTNKNLSDFAAALNEVKLLDPDKVEAYGFLGGRKDHEFAVLFESLDFVKIQKTPIRLIDNDQEWIIAYDKATLNRKKIFSVFIPEQLLGEESKLNDVYINGAEYSGDPITLERASHGISNQVVRDNCEIRRENKAFFVWSEQ